MKDPNLREVLRHTDVSAQLIAKVYAHALLDAAQKAGQITEVLDDYRDLAETLLNADERLGAFFSSAAIGRIARRAGLEKALKERVHPLLYNLLQVLNDHERLDLFRPILASAQNLDDERNRRLQVTVSTAVPLEEEFRRRVSDGVRTFFQLDPVLIEKVEPSLLGGMKVQIGDVVYDSTIRNRIDTLKHQLLARSSHEIQSGRDRIGSDAGN